MRCLGQGLHGGSPAQTWREGGAGKWWWGAADPAGCMSSPAGVRGSILVCHHISGHHDNRQGGRRERAGSPGGCGWGPWARAGTHGDPAGVWGRLAECLGLSWAWCVWWGGGMLGRAQARHRDLPAVLLQTKNPGVGGGDGGHGTQRVRLGAQALRHSRAAPVPAGLAGRGFGWRGAVESRCCPERCQAQGCSAGSVSPGHRRAGGLPGLAEIRGGGVG